jgi:hypothetical protein
MLPIVRSQMSRQWDLLNELRWAAASLEFERTHLIARGIIREVHCGRPATGGVSLSEVIPARYLELQDELGLRAQELARVALSTDRRAVTHAYGEMVRTCVRCHDLYRRQGPPLVMPMLSVSDR